MNRTILILLFFSSFYLGQPISIQITNKSCDKIFLQEIKGEKQVRIDSINVSGTNKFEINLQNKNWRNGLYRISFDNKWIDFIYDGNEVSINTDAKNVLDSLQVIISESNKLFYSFIRLNKAYKTKTELLQLILSRYPKDDPLYSETKKRLNEIQNEYIQFVNVTAQKDPASFIAKYILSAQLPIIDSTLPQDKWVDYLAAHALDNVNFNEASLINSDLFTNKTIEYLTYYRNPQLPKELLEKEFMKAVDTVLNKAKVNKLVYQHITEYMIDGFKKFSFDNVLDYIVENYVIKDDLCLDVKTEGMIKRRIEQAKRFKIGSVVPDFILPDMNVNEINLSKISSDKLLIVFYASWCPHCKELLPKLNELKRQQDAKLEILAISLDDKKDEWENFVHKNCKELINLSDLKGWDGKTANNYFIYATPTMFLVDREKRINAKPVNFDEVSRLLLAE